MKPDDVHLSTLIESVDQKTLEEKINIAKELFLDSQDDKVTYENLREEYEPLINASKKLESIPYPSLNQKIAGLSRLNDALQFAQERLYNKEGVSEFEQTRKRLVNHERRLTELKEQYDALAKEPSERGTLAQSRNLYSHVAAFTEQVEELHDEIEEVYTPLLDRANTLVEGASRLEDLTEMLSRDAKKHVNRRLGWFAAKIGSCIVVAAGALQLVEPLDIIAEKYLTEQVSQSNVSLENDEVSPKAPLKNAAIPKTTSSQYAPASVLALDKQGVEYVLYIDREKRQGSLYDLNSDQKLFSASCSLATVPGEKQAAGDGKLQSGVFGIEEYYLGEINPLYGAAFINLEDKPYAHMQIVGASLPKRIAAIKEGKDSTNGAVAFQNHDITRIVEYIDRHGANNGRVVIEGSR